MELRNIDGVETNSSEALAVPELPHSIQLYMKNMNLSTREVGIVSYSSADRLERLECSWDR